MWLNKGGRRKRETKGKKEGGREAEGERRGEP